MSYLMNEITSTSSLFRWLISYFLYHHTLHIDHLIVSSSKRVPLSWCLVGFFLIIIRPFYTTLSCSWRGEGHSLGKAETLYSTMKSSI
jgi:hypothetical protein